MDKPELVNVDGEGIRINHELPTLLLVDDEQINLKLLNVIFKEKYNLPAAYDGESGWNFIQAYPDLIDAVLLDRMMPNLTGDEVLKRVKSEKLLQHIPILFQTAKAAGADINEGLELGADYYITKPYDENRLIATVNTAIRKSQTSKDLSKELKKTQGVLSTLSLIDKGSFHFRTVQEAYQISLLLANIYPNPERILTGLIELTTNAVEHGIVQIGYTEK